MAKWTIDYWTTLVRLFQFRRGIASQLDAPMQNVIARSRWSAGWTGILVVLAAELRRPEELASWSQRLTPSPTGQALLIALILLLLCALSVPVSYGLLRLYTLVHHVMVMNVFKCRRGQRLRLLNYYAWTLPLVAPAAVGVVLTRFSPLAGWIVISVTALYYLYLTVACYNAIFHRTVLGGLGLWLGGTLVTWFVLFIGLVGIAVTFAVLAFFVLVIFRVFHRG